MGTEIDQPYLCFRDLCKLYLELKTLHRRVCFSAEKKKKTTTAMLENGCFFNANLHSEPLNKLLHNKKADK